MKTSSLVEMDGLHFRLGETVIPNRPLSGTGGGGEVNLVVGRADFCDGGGVVCMCCGVVQRKCVACHKGTVMSA